MTTWRREIEEHLGRPLQDGDVSIPPIGDWLDQEFNRGYGSPEGTPFLLWTQDRILFPVTYDGEEWVDDVPRNPADREPKHFGNW